MTKYERPESLSGDEVGKIDVIKDLLIFEENNLGIKFDFIIDLDVTSPLRNLQDLINAFKLFNDNKNALTLFSVSPANRSPYFNMVECKKNGFYKEVKKTKETLLTRQSTPLVFDLNLRGVITNKSIVYLVPHLCFDLDHLIDFEFLSFLLENNKINFEI